MTSRQPSGAGVLTAMTPSRGPKNRGMPHNVVAAGGERVPQIATRRQLRPPSVVRYREGPNSAATGREKRPSPQPAEALRNWIDPANGTILTRRQTLPPSLVVSSVE